MTLMLCIQNPVKGLSTVQIRKTKINTKLWGFLYIMQCEQNYCEFKHAEEAVQGFYNNTVHSSRPFRVPSYKLPLITCQVL